MLEKILKVFKPKSQRLIKTHRVSVETARSIKMDWRNIEVLLQGRQPSQLRQALITADRALDTALRDVVEGEKMGERLKNSRPLYEKWETYDSLWKAHKVRNALVHESGYEPPYYVVEESINNLKKGLNALGVNL